MKLCTKRFLFLAGVAFAAYFVLYFSSVQALTHKSAGPVTPVPGYHPDDGEFLHAVFAPAHFIDATVLRRGYWAPRQTSPNPAASLDGGHPVLFAFLAHWPAASEPQCSARIFGRMHK
jgi:hypothetical protein